MSSESLSSVPGPAGLEHFATTHWSVVLRAGQEDPEQSAEALEKLCRAYWYPLYVFVRRLGYAPHDAQDLTQSFFAHVLQTGLVAKARLGAGKFRSFLLASIKNFIASEWDRARAQKRGGGKVIFSLDEQTAEGRFAYESTGAATPETLYERAWAVTVLEQALSQLENEYESSGKQPIFEQLRVFLLGEKVARTYASVASDLGTSEGAVKMMVQRLRQRYRECLRAVVANTVTASSEIDAELQDLVRVLSA